MAVYGTASTMNCKFGWQTAPFSVVDIQRRYVFKIDPAAMLIVWEDEASSICRMRREETDAAIRGC
jgi:hypothetical protein